MGYGKVIPGVELDSGDTPNADSATWNANPVDNDWNNPANRTPAPYAVNINSALTFNSLSTYKCVLNRNTPIAGKITALGVTINSGASFTFVDVGSGTLTVGTVFTVINNTSANPIFGTFSNLADGSVFTSNGNNFQVSYEGGTGNDLTLTVVP